MTQTSFRIRTLTPIWTGNVRRESSKLRETSLLGSLRWWFEAIVRGFGGHACNPTGEATEKCEFSVEKYKKDAKPEVLLCPACYVFGTTGWSRRFRLEIEGEGKQLPLIVVKADERRGHRGWFLGTTKTGGNTRGSGGLIGTWRVNIYGDPQINNILALLLKVSCSWGIGAKIQDGFGICKFEGEYAVDEAINQVRNLISGFRPRRNSKLPLLPNMKDCFFARISIEEDISDGLKKVLEGKLFEDSRNEIGVDDFLQDIPEECKGRFYPTAPLVRHWLRSLFRNGNDNLRHFLLGFVSVRGNPPPVCKVHYIHVTEKREYFCPECRKVLRDEEVHTKMGSKIFVSHLYNIDNTRWEFKIWGYIPRFLPNNANREKILQKLFSEIQENKNFVDVLKLDKSSTEVEWYEVSEERSNISSVEELISAILS